MPGNSQSLYSIQLRSVNITEAIEDKCYSQEGGRRVPPTIRIFPFLSPDELQTVNLLYVQFSINSHRVIKFVWKWLINAAMLPLKQETVWAGGF